jgi:hypothetical protein
VVYGQAEHFGLAPARIFTNDVEHGGWQAEWIILSRNEDLLNKLRATEDNTKRDAPTPPLPVWTDQRHNLLEVLK